MRVDKFYKGLSITLFFVLAFVVYVRANTVEYTSYMKVCENIPIVNSVGLAHHYETVVVNEKGETFSFISERLDNGKPSYIIGETVKVTFNDNGTETIKDDVIKGVTK